MPRDREDFLTDYDPRWGNADEREYEDEGDGGPEFEDEDFCETHQCWKPYCRKDHEREDR
jgi:hypothetical protein